MESTMNESELQKQQKRAATRERVRKFRALQKSNSKIQKRSPMTGQERTQRWRSKKIQQSKATASDLPQSEIPDDHIREEQFAKGYSSRERMQRYRARLREQSGYTKAIPLSTNERCRRWYSKKKQLQIRTLEARKATQRVTTNISIEETALRKQAYLSWPRLAGPLQEMKEEILEASLKRLKRKIRSMSRGKHASYIGLQLDWNMQLYAFLKLQLKEEKSWKNAELQRDPTAPITSKRSRKELALLVAKSGGWGMWVMNRILRQEVVYIQSGKLPAPKQGKHAKVTSWLTDEGTTLAMREYMSLAGEGIFIDLNTYFINCIF